MSRKARRMGYSGDKPDEDDMDAWDRFDWEQVSDGATPAESISGSLSDDEGEASGAGEWVSSGGVLHWEEPEGESDDIATDLRREALSPWAAETITMPLGAPDALRVRAVRAWLARQRLLENESMGMLLLERRRQSDPAEAEDVSRHPRREAEEMHPLDVAMAEHQAAVEEYESLLAQLNEVGMHNGPGKVLVEYHFLLGDRIAALAAAPEAPEDFAETHLFMTIERKPATAPVTPLTRAEWDGHAGAVLQTRRRVEQVTAPEEEE